MIVESSASQLPRLAPMSCESIFFHCSAATIARVRPVSAISSPYGPGSQKKPESPARPPRTTTVSPPGRGVRSRYTRPASETQMMI